MPVTLTPLDLSAVVSTELKFDAASLAEELAPPPSSSVVTEYLIVTPPLARSWRREELAAVTSCAVGGGAGGGAPRYCSSIALRLSEDEESVRDSMRYRPCRRFACRSASASPAARLTARARSASVCTAVSCS